MYDGKISFLLLFEFLVLFLELFVVDAALQQDVAGGIDNKSVVFCDDFVRQEEFKFFVKKDIEGRGVIRVGLNPERTGRLFGIGCKYRSDFGMLFCKLQPEGYAHKARRAVGIKKSKHGFVVLPDKRGDIVIRDRIFIPIDRKVLGHCHRAQRRSVVFASRQGYANKQGHENKVFHSSKIL